MSLYGVADASAPNLNYPFDQALAAARALNALTGQLATSRSTRATQETHAKVDWLGPSRRDFVALVSADNANSTSAEGTLADLAVQIATQWSQARGQQDRINHARWALEQESNESGIRHSAFGNWLLGEEDYGPPPENPSIPTEPSFYATRDAIHPEHGQ